MELEKLIEKCEELFGPCGGSQCYQFTLGRIYGQWSFKVVDSWQRWSDATLKCEFRASTPGGAIEAFLAYVMVYQIDVKSLMEGYVSPAQAS